MWKNKRKAKGRAQQSLAISRAGGRGAREEPEEDWQSAGRGPGEESLGDIRRKKFRERETGQQCKGNRRTK